MRCLYDLEKIKQGIASGNTAINRLGDLLGKIDSIHQLMGQLYNNVCWQMITVGVPACRNYRQQEEEIVRHFEGMWDDKQYDLVGLLVSIPNKEELFMADEPYIPSIAAQGAQRAEEMDNDNPKEAPTIMPSSNKLLGVK